MCDLPTDSFKNVSMPDMKREEVCMSDSSNNNACTCSYTGSLEKEYFGTGSDKGSPSNSYKNPMTSNGKSASMVCYVIFLQYVLLVCLVPKRLCIARVCYTFGTRLGQCYGNVLLKRFNLCPTKDIWGSDF